MSSWRDREAARAGPSVRLSFVVTLAIAGAGCRIPPPAGDAPGGFAAGSSRGTAETAERRARLSVVPWEQADHYLEAATVYVELGLYPQAKRCLDEARATHYSDDAAGRIDRLLGRLYLETGEAVLAERYLIKGLAGAKGSDRQVTLARLVAATRSQGDDAAAERYLSRLSRPHSPEVREALEQDVRTALPRPDPTPTLAEALRRAALRASPGAAEAPSPGAGVDVLARARWQARPAGRNTQPMRRVRKITVHHTGGEDAFWSQTVGSAADEIRKIQRYHQREQGWADIGYHFLIDRAGNIWQGRDLRYQGAHARHENPGNIGIALLGNYTRQRLTLEQSESLERLVAMLARTYGISAGDVYTHREILDGKTACPGAEITRTVAAIRSRLRSDALAYR